ncbi:hypothetical protein ABW20_dc0109820 [Dactylellina cionopaga]|nr:hypothetical protein ABW20_dc0109820 [Dactylellina cionopaga]
MDADVDMVMDLDMDMDIQVTAATTTDVIVSNPSIVTPSEQQEWRNTIDAQIEEGRKQLEMTTIQIARVEEVIKPAKRYIPTKITAYFPSSPALSIPLNLRTSKKQDQIIVGSRDSDEENRKQREILEELARSLSSVSIRTRSRSHHAQQQQVVKSKPPPIGIGMMMGFKPAKSESLSPRLKGKEVDVSMAPTKITKRGVITGARGAAFSGRGRGAVIKRRNSGGRGDTISL